MQLNDPIRKSQNKKAGHETGRKVYLGKVMCGTGGKMSCGYDHNILYTWKTFSMNEKLIRTNP